MQTGNRILDRLPRNVVDRLRPDFERVKINRHQVIHAPGDEIKFLHFPLTCMISITVTTSDGRTVEAGAVGSREVVGINAFMGGGETTDTEYVGQVAGDAIKIAAEPLTDEFDRNSELRSVLLKYTQALLAHISQNVACNRLHEIDQRCARWLLEVRDRIGSDDFGLTQEFIAEMLGVNRSSVSLAMNDLKDREIVSYSRGNVKVLDSDALSAASCECYSILQKQYDRLLGAS